MAVPGPLRVFVSEGFIRLFVAVVGLGFAAMGGAIIVAWLAGSDG